MTADSPVPNNGTYRDALFAFPVQSRDTDERYTPAWIFEALGTTFDLDPAAAPNGAFVPAWRYLTAKDDGLAHEWHGLVWLNPPFSDMPRWVDRWIKHANGLLLFPWTDSDWHRRLLDSVPVVVLLDRPKFGHPTHTGRHVPVAIGVTALGDGIPLLARLDRPRGRVLTVGWAHA